MNLFFFNFLYGTLMHASLILVTKILIKERKVQLKADAYLLFVAILFSFTLNLIVPVFSLGFVLESIFSLFPIFSLFSYFYFLKSYSKEKAATFSFLVMLVSTLANFTWNLIFTLLFPAYMERFFYSEATPNFFHFLELLPFAFINFIFVIVFALLFNKTTKKVRTSISQNQKSLTVLSILSIAILVFLQIASASMHYEYTLTELITSPTFFFLVIFPAVLLIGFFFYTKALQAKNALKHKEREYKLLQDYSTQMEAQQTAMRKFKHDYQNILISMGYLIKEQDWEGLDNYFASLEATWNVTEE
ncbi:MAG: hypothetical protein FWE25_04970 [Lachnospiraceae bacterium]|nr:hypothetical protein [Lachnospiraceae bacterium]